MIHETREISIQNISPYIRYVNNHTFPSETVAERVIYDHEMIFGAEGEAGIRYGGQEYQIKEGDIFLLRPNIKNQMIVKPGRKFRAHCVHFDWFLEEEKFNFTAEMAYFGKKVSREDKEMLSQRPDYEVSEFYVPMLCTNLDYGVMEPLFKEIYRCFQKQGTVFRIRERAIFLQITAAIVEGQLTEQGVQRGHYHQKTIDEAVQYMKEHYQEALSTAVLAEYMGLSSKYFGVLFKSMTGKAVHEYLLEIRMQKARSLLIHTHMTVEEVSDAVGVGDVFYFTKLFKRHELVSPGKYRRMLTG